MYLKLQFREEIIRVPECWGGVLVSLKSYPEMMDKLPSGVTTNRRIDSSQSMKKNLYGFSVPHCLLRKFAEQNLKFPGEYDFYLKCKTNDVNEIKNDLENFLNRFENNLPSVVVNEDYPKVNPIVQQFEREFCHHHHHAKFFDSKETSGNDVEGQETLIRKLVC